MLPPAPTAYPTHMGWWPFLFKEPRILKGLSQVDAYRKAGGEAKGESARTQVSRMITFDNVKTFLDAMNQKAVSYSRCVFKLSFGQLKITTSLGLAIGVIVFYLVIYYIKKSFDIRFEPFLFQLHEHANKIGVDLLSFYVAIFILAPVCEEILFRGIFLNVFKSEHTWTLWLGALITSLILASFFLIDSHVSLFMESFILALIRAIARIRSGGLLLPILLHIEASFMAIVMGGLNSPYQNYIWF